MGKVSNAEKIAKLAKGAPYTDDGPRAHFFDMHSGGGNKLDPYERIYLQANEEQATKIFELLFDRDPNNITCHCCGEDYSISESPSLTEATEYHREVWTGAYGKEKTKILLEEYVTKKNVLIIPRELIMKHVQFKLVPEMLLLGDGEETSCP